jgi:multidrug efflux pump subunit AcrA (membrane-fusion protein)
MFGSMRLSTGQPTEALLVPDSAVQTDQARKIVMVVGPDGNLQPRPVVVGPLIEGLRVVRTGLAPKDRVVIAGAQLVMPGVKPKVQPGRILPQAVAAGAQPAPVPISGEATFAGR